MTYHGCLALGPAVRMAIVVINKTVQCSVTNLVDNTNHTQLTDYFSEMSNIQPYQFEPEYSGEDSNGENESESDGETFASPSTFGARGRGAIQSRLGDLSWCSCTSCQEMPTQAESMCCKEPSFLADLVADLPCITHHESFAAVCLNKDVLWTALVSLHDTESAGLPDRQRVSNRSFRYAAYRQFTWWCHGHLGKRIHRVIPSCAVTKIRNTFPEADGSYMGYKEGDDDDSLMDSEIERAWRDFVNEL